MAYISSTYNSIPQIIKGAILDCDGTLIDSLGAWQGVEEYLVGLSPLSISNEERRVFTSLNIPEIGNIFFRKYQVGKSAEHVISLIDDFMMDFYAHKSVLLPGVSEFLEACAMLDVPMCIVSSSPQRYLEATAKNTGISDYFKQIISVDDLNTTKREPRIFDYSREILGSSKQTTWGFDDSLYAIKTLKDASYKTVGIFDTHEGVSFEEWQKKATLVVYSFRELAVSFK